MACLQFQKNNETQTYNPEVVAISENRYSQNDFYFYSTLVHVCQNTSDQKEVMIFQNKKTRACFVLSLEKNTLGKYEFIETPINSSTISDINLQNSWNSFFGLQETKEEDYSLLQTSSQENKNAEISFQILKHNSETDEKQLQEINLKKSDNNQSYISSGTIIQSHKETLRTQLKNTDERKTSLTPSEEKEFEENVLLVILGVFLLGRMAYSLAFRYCRSREILSDKYEQSASYPDLDPSSRPDDTPAYNKYPSHEGINGDIDVFVYQYSNPSTPRADPSFKCRRPAALTVSSSDLDYERFQCFLIAEMSNMSEFNQFYKTSERQQMLMTDFICDSFHPDVFSKEGSELIAWFVKIDLDGCLDEYSSSSEAQMKFNSDPRESTPSFDSSTNQFTSKIFYGSELLQKPENTFFHTLPKKGKLLALVLFARYLKISDTFREQGCFFSKKEWTEKKEMINNKYNSSVFIGQIFTRFFYGRQVNQEHIQIMDNVRQLCTKYEPFR